MQHQLTIQEAIFVLSTLNKQVDRLNRQFYSNFFGPVAIDDKALSQQDKATDNKESLEYYQKLIADISRLREVINNANTTYKVNGKSISYQLEWIRLQRQLIQQLEQLLERSEIRVENGVGVVDYRPYAEEDILLQLDQLTKEVNQLSTKIDQSNASNIVVVNLFSEI